MTTVLIAVGAYLIIMGGIWLLEFLIYRWRATRILKGLPNTWFQGTLATNVFLLPLYLEGSRCRAIVVADKVVERNGFVKNKGLVEYFEPVDRKTGKRLFRLLKAKK